MPGALGFFKRSLAIVDSRASSGGGAMREQQLDRSSIAVRRRPVQRRLAAAPRDAKGPG